MMDYGALNEKVKMVTDIANLLRGPYSSERYGDVIIPLSIIRRFDCILASKNEDIKKELQALADKGLEPQEKEQLVSRRCGVPFYNEKCLTLEELVGDASSLDNTFKEFVGAYSISVQKILKGLQFQTQIDTMVKKGLLFQVVKAFSELDFNPEHADPLTMGYIFEEIIRTYKANAEAGDHYTPREVIELCVDLMLADREQDLLKQGKVLRAYDGCCGTGGMLTVMQRRVHELSQGNATVKLFGEDSNDVAYATCCAEMLMLGEDANNIVSGNTLLKPDKERNSDVVGDAFYGQKFDLLLTNPPFGVEWKNEKTAVLAEAASDSKNNRFRRGTPRISDGQMLFLENLLAKAEDDARIAIILNGSPLFSGDAGSGESEIRRYVVERGLLEAIVALPDQMFYNTGINTYIWVLSKRHMAKRQGKVQLINATEFFEPQKPKSLGNKRKYISKTDRQRILELYVACEENEYSKFFEPREFGYTKVVVDRPLLDAAGQIVTDKKGKPKADSAKRDTENIPLLEDVDAYLAREVYPYAPDAFVDRDKDKVGYEIPFTRYFYHYQPPRPAETVLREILELEQAGTQSLQSLLK